MRWWTLDSTQILRGLDRMPLLRQLALEPMFRWACLLLLLVCAGFGLGMVPVWVVTPSGFHPVIRISGLDFLESLEHGWRCDRAWERGAVDAALLEWRTALARHPARIRLLRRGLERVAALPAMERRDPKYQGVIGQAQWLLRLTRTNRVDADLVTRALDGPYGETGLMAFLDQMPGQPTPVQRAVKLVAQVRAGGFGEKEPAWPVGTRNRVLDREVALCRIAWMAAHAEFSTAAPAWKQLEACALVREEEAWALQLQLWVLAVHGDLIGYETVFARLQRLRSEMPIHSITHWKMLVNRGRVEEARVLARSYCGAPVNSREVCLLAEAFFNLGLDAWALDFLRNQTFAGSHGLEVWLMYSGELARRELWESLSETGIRLRALNGGGGWQQGLGLYLEGLSRHGRGERESARRCFDRASRFAVRPAFLGLELGRRVLELGYPECSVSWLENYEHEYSRHRHYWRCRARAASQLRNWAAVEIAAKHWVALDPGELAAWNVWVEAGLQQEMPTADLMARSEHALALDPHSLLARLNRVVVLVRAGRLAEAKAWISLIDEEEIHNPLLSNRLHAARFELCAGVADWGGALEAWKSLDLEGLNPSWAIRLKKLWRRHELDRGGVFRVQTRSPFESVRN